MVKNLSFRSKVRPLDNVNPLRFLLSLFVTAGSAATIWGIRSQRDGPVCYILVSLDGGPAVNTSTTSVITGPDAYECHQTFYASPKIYYDNHQLEVTVGWNASDCFNFVGADISEDTTYLDPAAPRPTSTSTSISSTPTPTSTSTSPSVAPVQSGGPNGSVSTSSTKK